jgi:CubicO group peptidase (beta-lactamase class C family)
MRRSTFFVAAISLFSAFPVFAEPGSLPEATLERIVDTYAGNFYRKGEAGGVSVAITLNGQVYYKSFGYRSQTDQSPANEVNEHSIFEIGSVTKIWTTALVGQAVATGGFTSRPIDINTTLGGLSSQLPSIQATMKPATIGDLASFTAGFPENYSPIQDQRPSYLEWGVADFVSAISTLVPEDYSKTKVGRPTTLPAPYTYSDFSTGILGLLVTNDLDQALPVDAVARWWTAIQENLVIPLGMTDTYVFEPSVNQASRLVKGYRQATAVADVTAQRVVNISLTDRGTGYTSAPTVTIVSDVGSGATAQAILDAKGAIRTIFLTNRGSGYRGAPDISITGTGRGASAQAIVEDGKVAGVQILNGGKGYGPGTTFRFGSSAGNGAAAVPIIADGQIVGAKVTNPGSGYYSNPQVVLSPGPSVTNRVPVWAAAGAIKSSASDLVRICQLYLGQTEIDGHAVSPELSLGARFALQPLASKSTANTAELSAMAWDYEPLNLLAGYNLQISKDGGLNGFGSYVTLVPAVKLGVVVLCNNHNSANYDKTSLVANSIALAIQLELKAQQ